jgi:hypothetical protein
MMLKEPVDQHQGQRERAGGPTLVLVAKKGNSLRRIYRVLVAKKYLTLCVSFSGLRIVNI